MRKEILPAASVGVAGAVKMPAIRGSGIWWIVAVGIFAGIVFPLTNHLVGMLDGDCIIPSIMSTQKLTWYFWGQDRLLNFIPALAKPFTAIEWNLRFQIFLRTFFQYLAPVGILYVFNQSARVLALATVLTNGFLVLATTQLIVFNLYVAENPYGTSLVLFALSLFALRRCGGGALSMLLALVVSVIAYATNISLLIVSMPVIVVAMIGRSLPMRQLLVFLAINVLGFVLAIVHARYYGIGTTSISTAEISFSAIRTGYAQVLQNIAWPAFIALGALAVFAGYRRNAPNVHAVVFLMLCWIVFVAPLSCSGWVQLNGFNVRYFSMLVVAFVACAGYLLACAYYSWLDNVPADVAIIGAVLAIAIFVGLKGVSRNYDQLVGVPWRDMSSAVADETLKSRADLIVGTYWDVWPAVFDALDKQQKERMPPRDIYGATFRSFVLRRRVLALARRQGSLRALCFLPAAQACADLAQDSLHAKTELVPGSVSSVMVDNKPMLLMNFTFEH
jgi:hypothetical protein